jgi:hypothetical protein
MQKNNNFDYFEESEKNLLLVYTSNLREKCVYLQIFLANANNHW